LRRLGAGVQQQHGKREPEGVHAYLI
jgi:hypothetical protein